MARSSTTLPPTQNGRRASVPSTVQLALWRVRRTWGLLLVTGVGMIAAVMIVCAVPLYSQVAMTAGLRGALKASPQNVDVLIQGTSEQLSAQALRDLTGRLQTEFQSTLQPYLGPAHFSIETQVAFIVNAQTLKASSDQVQLVSEPAEQLSGHGTLLRGRFPRNGSPGSRPTLEVALTAQEASQLHVDLGSELTIQQVYVKIPVARELKNITLQVVGIFTPVQSTSFWHQHDFQSQSRGQTARGSLGSIYTVLTSNDGMISVFNQFATSSASKNLALEEPFTVYWDYQLDPQRITIDSLDTLVNGVNVIQVDIANDPHFNVAPYIEKGQAVLPSDILTQYHNRVPVAQIPVYSLLLLVVALVLFFVSMMADLLIDRQAEAVSILRSRGASRSQVFGSFATQGIGLGLVALVAGPLLALVLVPVLARWLLPSEDQQVLHILTDNLPQTLLGLAPYALGTALIAIVAMVVAINRAARSDVLALRREAARSRYRALWLRLNLDLVAAIVMLVGYAFLLYLTNSGALDAQTRLLLLSPLTLLGAVFLLIACILLFLRIFPFLLGWGARLAARNRGAAPMLALAQMARTPRQSLRMTLLLAFATAFAFFTLVFLPSQAQRVQDVAAFQIGADFSGPLAHQGQLGTLANMNQRYRKAIGKNGAVSLGFSASLQGGDIQAIPIELRAVDADSFANVGSWSTQDSSEPLSSLMQLLIAHRSEAMVDDEVVPAIVDSATARALHIKSGGRFTLNDASSSGQITPFIVVAQVNYIPSINSGVGSGSDYVPSGGVLVDYQSYATYYNRNALREDIKATIPVNYAWLSAKSDQRARGSVRQVLQSGALRLAVLQDQDAMREGLAHEPLYLDLLGVLAIGATTALLLALAGNLIASWLSARNRLTSFAVMRALGTSPAQIASILTWEQGIIYLVSILLGVVFGALLAELVVPVLVFTGAPNSGGGSGTSSSAFYIAQSIPPIQVIFSPWLWGALGVLIVICVVALGLMIRVVSRPSISQTLRLNED